jgi:hypothetical protein
MRITLIFVLMCFMVIGLKAQKYSIGTIGSVSYEQANFVGNAKELKSKDYPLTGIRLGVDFRYNFNDYYSIKAVVSWRYNDMTILNNMFFGIGYQRVPVDLLFRTNLLRFNKLKVYIENGLSVGCNYDMGGIQTTSTTGLEMINNMTNQPDVTFSYGFINGTGISYTFESGFGFDFFVNYYSGINDVWECDDITVIRDGVSKHYALSSRGSAWDVGIGLKYSF